MFKKVISILRKIWKLRKYVNLQAVFYIATILEVRHKIIIRYKNVCFKTTFQKY